MVLPKTEASCNAKVFYFEPLGAFSESFSGVNGFVARYKSCHIFPHSYEHTQARPDGSFITTAVYSPYTHTIYVNIPIIRPHKYV